MPEESPAEKPAASHATAPESPPEQPAPEASQETPLTREQQLERALDSGVSELPPNQPRGILGERNPNIRATENFTPDLNAGISQEVDLPVIWMAIVLAFVTILFSPVGYVVLWRTKSISRRAKIAWTVIATVWVVAALLYIGSR